MCTWREKRCREGEKEREKKETGRNNPHKKKGGNEVKNIYVRGESKQGRKHEGETATKGKESGKEKRG